MNSILIILSILFILFCALLGWAVCAMAGLTDPDRGNQ